jgi:hypothetical protein
VILFLVSALDGWLWYRSAIDAAIELMRNTFGG